MSKYLKQLGGLSDFHTRQRILLILLVAGGIFMLFYWTQDILSERRSVTAAAVTNTKDRIARVQTLIQKIDDNSEHAKVLDTGLLSYVQGVSGRGGLGNKLTNIRLVSSANRQEQVTFRTEGLVLREFTDILKDIEQYDNVWIKSMTVSKRFDNPNRLDVSWDIVRSEQ